ncbi:MAG: hypothetical protein ACKOD9_09470 [Rubrivivax sp.]
MDPHRGFEVALGLQQFARLTRRCIDQARQFALAQALAAGQGGQARQVQMAFEQCLKLDGCLDLDGQ